MQSDQFQQLVLRYNKPVPRYTSYPTVPVWKEGIDQQQYIQLLQQQFQFHNQKEGISFYIHLPFCESLCTYCGCNKKITTNHGVEVEYLEIIEKEFELYLSILHNKPVIRELHLGGGTPTFFSPANLERLMHFITERSVVHPHHEFSIEGHPNNTTREHLETLYTLGFRRVSYGVQDNDPEVQRIINRIQPIENVRRATADAREIGFESVNYDLIYGLPKQSLESITRTIQQVVELRPDRIAFYSYAHLPSAFPAQKTYSSHLPNEQEKRALYELGKELLIEMGYEEIGMDHFALPNEPLFIAKQEGKLHRNFMGYTTLASKMLIGLGASSISDVWIGFAQNEKKVESYEEALTHYQIPVVKGHALTSEDLEVRTLILNLICKGESEIPESIWSQIPTDHLNQLHAMVNEGLIELEGKHLKITNDGMAVVRNICSLFDLKMMNQSQKKVSFSKAI